jgi:YHS domain-containing protein
MNPLRILLLVLLVYLLFRLIRGPNTGGFRRGKGPDSIKHDILIEDPVCHVYVPKSQAVTLERNEKFYYFCSKKCRDAFCSKEDQSS